VVRNKITKITMGTDLSTEQLFVVYYALRDKP